MPGPKYYAVAKGRQPGIYDNWDACKANVDKYSNNSYKKFDSPNAAGEFIKQEYIRDVAPSGSSGSGGNNSNAK